MTKNRSMKTAAFLSILALGAFGARAARADEPIDDKSYITPAQNASRFMSSACSICHGANGISKWTYIPSLAGMDKTYLIDQLTGLREKKRADHYAQAAMWGMAVSLKDDDIAALADYLSALQPPKGESPRHGANLALGQSIFEKGLPDRSVPACQTCHVGGRGDVNIPRVAGQHAEYMTRTLREFHRGFRVNDNMNFITGKMSDDEIVAVSDYMSTLTASGPAPAPAAQ